MKLIEQFSLLSQPSAKHGRFFNAETISRYPFAKIAVNSYGFPVILISSSSDSTFLSQKNIRLKYLELTHKLECKITVNESSTYANFTVIIFKSAESNLQSYFLSIAETLLQSLSDTPSQKEVLVIFKGFIEIFRSLTVSPSKTVQGLWSELFLIVNSIRPNILLNYWHDSPNDKFDFNADVEGIEVKSSSKIERIHFFTSEQLNPPTGKVVIVASIFTKQNSRGKSISDMIEMLLEKVSDKNLLDKLFLVLSTTLGNTVEQGIKVKFDYNLASNSLRFYSVQQISKIEAVNIPNQVSDVKYKSDLTNIEDIDVRNEYDSDYDLINAL